jgi:TPR repeat protein
VIERAINQDEDAFYAIGEIYYYKEDYQKSLAWFLKAASKEHSNAQNRIGYQYQHGYGVPLDCKIAMEWYLKADANGNRNAPNNIGWLYHNGQGVSKDQKLALNYYIKSGIRGHKVAQSNIGISLEKGRGIAVDKQHALEWYQRSADQGYQKAKECIEKLNTAGFQLDIKQLGKRNRLIYFHCIDPTFSYSWAGTESA